MSFRVGDIVVSKWSGAKKLKRKVFRVIDVPLDNYLGTVRVVDPWGKQRKISHYRLRKLEEQEDAVKLDIQSAERIVVSAEQKVLRLKKQLVELREEVKQVPSYFPRI